MALACKAPLRSDIDERQVGAIQTDIPRLLYHRFRSLR